MLLQTPLFVTPMAEGGGLVVLAIYLDSYVFVFATAMLQHTYGVNASLQACDSAILLCLVCYVTTKVSLCPVQGPVSSAAILPPPLNK